MNQQSKSFDSFFELITPKLNAIEELRQKIAGTIKKLRVGVVLTIISFILACFLYPGFWLLLALFFVLLYFILRKYQALEAIPRVYIPKFKQEVIFSLVDYFYNDAVYIPNQRISRVLLNKSLLFHYHVYRHTGEDYINCRIGNTDIYMSEILTDASEFFRGVFIAALFNKNFKTKTIVLPRKRNSVFRKLKLNVYGDMTEATYIELENPTFKKEFVVIAESQVESRYVLTPALMQRMLTYKEKFGESVSFSFVDNYMYVAIESKINLFEPHVFKPINTKRFLRDNYNHLENLTGIAENLDLNTRIWL